MNKKLKFNQPKKSPLPDDFVSIRFSPATDESYIGKSSGIGGTTPSHKLDISGQSLIKKDGHIRMGMDRKVYFEYYGLEKPEPDDYRTPRGVFITEDYDKAMKEYEASKQLIEVSNVRDFLGTWVLANKEVSVEDLETLQIKNNQPCKAEVVGKIATIIELLT